MAVSREGSKRSFGQGFSLIEVLVALAITAVMLGVLLPAAGSSLARLKATGLRAGALGLAQSKLERYSAVARFETGTFEGHEPPFQWTVSIDSATQGPDVAASELLALRRIQVRVGLSGKSEPLVSISTVRIAEVR